MSPSSSALGRRVRRRGLASSTSAPSSEPASLTLLTTLFAFAVTASATDAPHSLRDCEFAKSRAADLFLRSLRAL